jgi:undecaprenyl-diphosphatase
MLRAIVLGVVQGITEFLPVSSSGHLVLVPYILTWGVEQPIPNVPTLAFDVAVHLGTLVALLVYFRRDLAAILGGSARAVRGSRTEGDRANLRLLGMLAIATVPAALAGLLLKDFFEGTFEAPQWVAVQLLVTAGLLVGADAMHERREHHRDFVTIGVGDALVIGVMQAVSILPGISRSGATIAGAMARGLGREAAARFSFLLAIPAIIGAAIVTLPDLKDIPTWGPVIAGTVVSGVVGFASIAFLLRYLRTNRLRPFAVYCVVFAIAALAFWAQVK